MPQLSIVVFEGKFTKLLVNRKTSARLLVGFYVGVDIFQRTIDKPGFTTADVAGFFSEFVSERRYELVVWEGASKKRFIRPPPLDGSLGGNGAESSQPLLIASI
jgi:hypothetical protein